MPGSLKGPLRGMVLATQFLTKLPTPQVEDFQPEDLTRSAAWFPAVGLLIGALLVGMGWLAQGQQAALVALLLLLLWTWVTGGLHLDGLADLCDALGASHRDPQRFFDVLRDPHLGSFGVIALVLALLSKIVLLAMLPHAALPALLLVPAWARLGPLIWVSTLPPLHAGMGDRFAWKPERRSSWLWALALFAASRAFAPRLLVAPLILLAWRLFLMRRLGGQCGDALGAGIEVTELCCIMVLAI